MNSLSFIVYHGKVTNVISNEKTKRSGDTISATGNPIIEEFIVTAAHFQARMI